MRRWRPPRQESTQWALNDRELPGGGTPAQRYAQHEDLDPDERDVAGRIAAARLRLLDVLGVMPAAGSSWRI